MAAATEAVMAALFSQLSASYAFGYATRRLENPEGFATPGVPAFYLALGTAEYEQRPSLPPKRVIKVKAVAYIDVGTDPNQVPETILNPIEDALVGALKVDDVSRNRVTLGGLVDSVVIKGPTIRASGDKPGKGLLIVHLEITVP